MKTSEAGYELIKRFEGCFLVAYPDPKSGGDPYTVGWGSTGPDVRRGTVWTQEQADAHLTRDVERFEAMANNAITVAVTQGQWDAFISILFNVGPGSAHKDGILRLKSGIPSTLLRMLNAGDYDGCADQFLRWVSPGSNVERGLKRRRTAERIVFLGGEA